MKIGIILLLMIIFVGTIPISFGGTTPDYYDPEKCDHEKIFCIDSRGGDCKEIGIWTSSSKTCQLSDDVYGVIWLQDDGVVLDGNGHRVFVDKGLYRHTLTSMARDSLAKISIRADNITVKNIEQSSDDLSPSYADVSINCRGDYTGLNLLNSKFTSTGVGLCTASLIKNNEFINYSGFSLKSNNNFFENYFEVQQIHLGSNNIIQNNTFKNIFQGIFFLSGGHSKNNDISNNYIETVETGKPFSSSGDIGGGSKNQIYNNHIKTYEKKSSGLSGQVIFENYWENYDSSKEGCEIISTSNFCKEPLVSDQPKMIDPRPWHIKNGWLYEISVPENMTFETDQIDGIKTTFDVFATGPQGKISVSCTPDSESVFDVGTTQVICKTPNGIVNTFDVTVNYEAPSIFEYSENKETENQVTGSLSSTPDSNNNEKTKSVDYSGWVLLIIIIPIIIAVIWKLKSNSNNSTKKTHQSISQDTNQNRSTIKTPINSALDKTFIEEKRIIWQKTGENFFQIREWNDKDGNIFLKLRFDKHSTDFFINREKTPGKRDYGVTFPVQMSEDVVQVLRKEISTDTQYVKGTSRDITQSGINTFELIEQIPITRNGIDSGTKINVKLMYNMQNEKIFLSNVKLDGTEKRGAVIPRHILSGLIEEISKF
ncbi:MAG: hypothetical protein HOK63_00350 [Thaumarchaeota archaeon]|jgi:hypothetical protein|nr:hypothetical protein [Nitrososphaerota archaeon]MBT6468092.1 hypothetical protein [Nitrososphaerota archaeon]